MSKKTKIEQQTLAELNGLVISDAGVYQAKAVGAFNYSDGESTEKLLASILSSAEDLSSTSPELESKIVDWPTEYHLSQTRANLLRPLDLSGVKRVLELGCGCGSITRYLGEQDALEVDSVEGSLVRAQLAALRCRDLENTNVHVGNFNDFIFPEEQYDLVLFVGVTEYAGRFSDSTSDQAALQDLLTVAKKAVKTDGVVAIAIENRLGLKYLIGASEDHYGVPWVGVEDYPESTGIRTYSHEQWVEQINQSAFSQARFCYPFPDYKVPSVVMSDEAANDSNNSTYLTAVRSRDYLRPFKTPTDEAKLWAGIMQGGSMAEFANSFLIMLGESSARINTMIDFGVRTFPSPEYDWHAVTENVDQVPLPCAPVEHSQTETIDQLNKQIAALTEHNQQLSAYIALHENSTAGRLLTRLRRLLGR